MNRICKDAAGKYILAVFTIYNVVMFDMDVAGIPLKLLLLLVLTLAALLLKLCAGELRMDALHDRKDGFAAAVILIALLWLIKNVIFSPLELAPPLILLTLGLIYVVAGHHQRIRGEMLAALSGSNAILYLIMLWRIFLDEGAAAAVQLPISEDSAASFLTLGIVVSVLGFCTYEGMQLWYGANALVGAFLLFAEKNLTAAGIVGVAFLLIPLVYKPTKKLIKRCMQLCFAYWLLFCNMSLLTGYVDLFSGLAQYDLEISVYMELVLAVFAVCFFALWDKYFAEAADDAVVYEFRELYRKALTVCVFALAAFGIAVISGRADSLSAPWAKAAAQLVESVTQEKGLLVMAGEHYGVLGVLAALGVLCAITHTVAGRTDCCASTRFERVIAVVYVLQALFLTQTMINTPFYLIFLLMYFNAEGGWRGKRKGNRIRRREEETVDEAHHTDTVLQ